MPQNKGPVPPASGNRALDRLVDEHDGQSSTPHRPEKQPRSRDPIAKTKPDGKALKTAIPRWSLRAIGTGNQFLAPWRPR